MSVSYGLNLPLDLGAELRAATETTLLGGGPPAALSISMVDLWSVLSATEGAEVQVGRGKGRRGEDRR